MNAQPRFAAQSLVLWYNCLRFRRLSTRALRKSGDQPGFPLPKTVSAPQTAHSTASPSPTLLTENTTFERQLPQLSQSNTRTLHSREQQLPQHQDDDAPRLRCRDRHPADVGAAADELPARPKRRTSKGRTTVPSAYANQDPREKACGGQGVPVSHPASSLGQEASAPPPANKTCGTRYATKDQAGESSTDRISPLLGPAGRPASHLSANKQRDYSGSIRSDDQRQP
jgi:hypothetical protein